MSITIDRGNPTPANLARMTPDDRGDWLRELRERQRLERQRWIEGLAAGGQSVAQLLAELETVASQRDEMQVQNLLREIDNRLIHAGKKPTSHRTPGSYRQK